MHGATYERRLAEIEKNWKVPDPQEASGTSLQMADAQSEHFNLRGFQLGRELEDPKVHNGNGHHAWGTLTEDDLTHTEQYCSQPRRGGAVRDGSSRFRRTWYQGNGARLWS